MPFTEGSEHSREASTRRLQERMRLRAARSEGVGILRVWHICGSRQAREDLTAAGGPAGRDVEAARVIAVVDAEAEHGLDPDAMWD
jgi:hypothetical protein